MEDSDPYSRLLVNTSYWSVLDDLGDGRLHLVGALLVAKGSTRRCPLHLYIDDEVITSAFYLEDLRRVSVDPNELRIITRDKKHNILIIGYEADFWWRGSWHCRATGQAFTATTWAPSEARAASNFLFILAGKDKARLNSVREKFTPVSLSRLLVQEKKENNANGK